jgi:hypothetical protein
MELEQEIKRTASALEAIRLVLVECDKRVVGQTITKDEHEKIASLRRHYIWGLMRFELIKAGSSVDDAGKKASELVNKIPERVFELDYEEINLTTIVDGSN